MSHQIPRINEPQGFVGNEAEAAALGRQFETLFAAQPIELDGGVIVSVPKGRELRSLKPFLDEYLAKPERRRGTVTANDADSFVAIVKRFMSLSGSVVFANPSRTAPHLLAIFDYNPALSTEADWLEHRARYAPELSEEWKAWSGKNGQFMQVADFAQFIEDRLLDLEAPAHDDDRLQKFAERAAGKWAQPTDLVALSRGLQVNVDATVAKAVSLDSGEVSVRFEEVNRPSLEVPNLFQIAIPVFFNGARYRLDARLRYRVNQGTILWKYELVRPDLAFDDAFQEIAGTVAEETGLPVYVGAPER